MNDDVALPLDAYALTPEQDGQRDLAMSVLIGECMGRAGYTEMDNVSEYRRRSENATQIRIRHAGATGHKGRYGLVDPAAAAAYGYHEEPHETEPEPPWLDKSSFTPAKSKAYGGCLLEAAQAIVGQVEVQGSTSGGGPGAVSVGQPVVNGEGPGKEDPYTAVAKGYVLDEDPSVRAAIAGWSACMKEKGYSYATPNEAQGFFTGASGGSSTGAASPEEIATAKADVACKERTGLVRTSIDAETRLQTALIDQHFEALQAQKAANEAMMRRAADVLARI